MTNSRSHSKFADAHFNIQREANRIFVEEARKLNGLLSHLVNRNNKGKDFSKMKTLAENVAGFHQDQPPIEEGQIFLIVMRPISKITI